MAAPKLHLTHAGHAAIRRVEGHDEPKATPVRIELRMRRRVSRAEVARTALELGGLAAVRRVRQIRGDGQPVVLLAEVRVRVTPADLYDVLDACENWAGVEKVTFAALADEREVAALVGAAA